MAWGALLLALVGAPGGPTTEAPIFPKPYVEKIVVDDQPISTDTVASGPEGLVYLGQKGDVLVYDGERFERTPIPTVFRLLKMVAEADHLWFAGEGDFGYVPISNRRLGAPVSLKSRVTRELTGATALWVGPNEVHFGTGAGVLVTCKRPIATGACRTAAPPDATSRVRYGTLPDGLDINVRGQGLFQYRQGAFDLLSDDPWLDDVMVMDAPGRTPGERLLATRNRGLRWLGPNGSLSPVDLGPEPLPRRLTSGRKLADGGYVLGTVSDGVVFLDARGKLRERWADPSLFESRLALPLHEGPGDTLWFRTAYFLWKAHANPDLRVFQLPDPGDLVRAIVDTPQGTFVLSHSTLFRLRTRPSRLEPTASFELARAMDVVGGKVLVGATGGVFEVEGSSVRPVWASNVVIEDIQGTETDPSLLVVGHLSGVTLLRRRGATYQTELEVPLGAYASRLTFVGPDEAWARYGGIDAVRLRRTGEAWEAKKFPGAGDRANTLSFVEGAPGQLWASRGHLGLHTVDRETGNLTHDGRFEARLGAEPGNTYLLLRADNPRTLYAESPAQGPLERVWWARRELGSPLAQAPWQEIPAWYLKGIGRYHSVRSAVKDRLLMGSQGQLLSIAAGVDTQARPPVAPLILEVTARSQTSTAVRRLDPRGEHIGWRERIEVRMASPEHHPGSRIEYRMRVPELSSRWSEWDSSTRRQFAGLPTGAVRVEIQSRDESHQLSPMTRFTFTVDPPFYLSFPAIVGYIVLAVLALVVAGLVSTSQLRRRARRLAAELSERRKSEALARGQAQLLGRALASLAERPQVDTFVEEILSTVRTTLEAEAIYLWGVDDQGELEMRRSLPNSAPPLSVPPEARSTVDLIEGDGALWLPLQFGAQPVGWVAAVEPRAAFEEPLRSVALALVAQVTLAMRLSDLAGLQRERAVLAERMSMSREVHDNLAQSFMITGLQLEKVLLRAQELPPSLRKGLEAAVELNREGLAEARRSIMFLRTQAFDQTELLSLLESLRTRVEAFDLQFGLAVDGATEALPPAVVFEIYRIAGEAVTNALKHAQATSILIEVRCREDAVTLSVHDDGVGMSRESREGGLGVFTMRERARSIGGELSIVSNAPSGTRVELLLSHAAAEAKPTGREDSRVPSGSPH